MKLYLYVILAILTTYTNAHLGEPINEPFVEKYKSRRLDFIAVGDWGSRKNHSQKIVADDMKKWAEKYKSDFIINVGDNFYANDLKDPKDYDGVKSVDDPRWELAWKKPYRGRLGKIPWFTVAGNHDWYGNITAQIEYFWTRDYCFFFPSTFYVRESYFGPRKTKVAWIHIDTNLFYYDQTDQPKSQKKKKKKIDPAMKDQFTTFGWSTEQAILDKLKWIEDRLIEQRNTKWIFVVGHQPLAGKCANRYHMRILRLLFEKYRVAAYFSGHRHALELEPAKRGQPVTYFLSGAGSISEKPKCAGEAGWSKGNVLGFLHATLTENVLFYQFVDSSNSKVVYRGKVKPRPRVALV